MSVKKMLTKRGLLMRSGGGVLGPGAGDRRGWLASATAPQQSHDAASSATLSGARGRARAGVSKVE